jgi:predicted MFS family arabinose efflux permease
MKDPTGMATATTRLPLLILICSAAVLALNMGIRQTFGLFLEPVTLDLAMSRSNFALAIAVQNLLWGLLTPACGMLADRYGTGRVLAAGGLLYALGNAVMALGEQFLLLPFSQVLIEGLGWPAALLILAVMATLIVPLAAALAGKPAMVAAGPASLGGALSQAGRHRGYLLLTAGFFVCGFHVSFIATHLPGYITSCNLDPLVGASALGLIGFFNILGGLAAGVLGSRFRLKYVLSMIYLARAVAIGLFLLGPKTEWAVFAFSAAFGLLWLSTVPLTSSLVGQIFGSRFMATLFGFVMLGHQLGAFFGAWLGGLSYDLTGSYDGVWILSILLGLLAAALHWPIADRPIAAQPAAAATDGVA